MLSIAHHTLTFVQNPFANYVVQFVLRMKVPEVSEVINNKLISDIINLSKQKFSSNVIEKCLEFNTGQMNKNVVAQLVTDRHLILGMLSD